jgi:hypothetical protein
LLLPHVELVLRRLDLQRARQECGKASGAGSAEAATELRKKKDGEKRATGGGCVVCESWRAQVRWIRPSAAVGG